MKKTIQRIWTENGDALSKQYTGTAALKTCGDHRSHQRRLVGMVKDGYNSASRYYISHLRDEWRQQAIDALLGVTEVRIKSNIIQ